MNQEEKIEALERRIEQLEDDVRKLAKFAYAAAHVPTTHIGWCNEVGDHNISWARNRSERTR